MARYEVEVQRLRREIARLQLELDAAREAVERERHRADAAQADATVRREPLVTPPASIEESDVAIEELDPAPTVAAPPPTVAAPAPPTAPAPAGAAVPVTPEARRLYDRGYALFHEGRYPDAAAVFGEYLERYAATALADNAQFWIGECEYARGRYEAALQAFMRTVENYPSGNKVADALVKAGKSLERLGDKASAAETYREVLRRFPDSAAAIAAGERLERLRSALNPHR